MSDRPIDLILINDDPVFQLGLQAALAAYPDLRAIAAVEPANAADRLTQLESTHPQVALVEWAFFPSSSTPQERLQLFEQLKAVSPQLRILLLSAPVDAQLLQSARAAGVEGYCVKGIAIDAVVEAVRQVAGDRAAWPALPPVSPNKKVWGRWRAATCRSGLRQIDGALEAAESYLNDPQLPLPDWLFWTGRRRELRAARWVVERLGGDETGALAPPVPLEISQRPAEAEANSQSLVPASPNPLSNAPSLLQQTLEQIQPGVVNASGISLALDILRPDKQQELLYLALHQIEEVIAELRYLQIPAEELPQRRSQILQEMWQALTLNFYNKYYAPDLQAESIVDLLRQDGAAVQRATLNPIPFVGELFAYLLCETPLTIDNVPYRYASPEAEVRAKDLLDHLVLQIANGAMQWLLNRFPEVEPGKYRLYDPRYFSSREIAQLRNNLSWQYRRDYYWETPKAIFESRHRLLTLRGNTIRTTFISASRLAELKQLQGIPWWVTIALETRDAIAPRLRAVVAFLGEGAIYLLTQVVGKAIGLIGRGMIQGFGNALQETRYGKNGQGQRSK